MHKRLGAMGQAKYQKPFHVLQQWPDALDIPLRARKPTTYFVNSMSDLFHKDVPDDFIAAVFGVMAACPQHTFQVLTKRAERMAEWGAWAADQGVAGGCPIPMALTDELPIKGLSKRPIATAWPLPNVWLGVSVETQEYADERIPHLLATPAAVRFVSYEPALGPVDFFAFLRGDIRDESLAALRSPPMPGLDWIIVGGESGHGARPFDLAWARSTIAQCRAAGTAVFFKQAGSDPMYRPDTGLTFIEDGGPLPVPLVFRDRKGGDMAEWAVDLRVREWPTRESAAAPAAAPTP